MAQNLRSYEIKIVRLKKYHIGIHFSPSFLCLRLCRSPDLSLTHLAPQLCTQSATERLYSIAPFTTTGVDYAGPYRVTSAHLRGAVTTKAYLVVFICFATNAVNLELASDLSSPAFLGAYRCFVARRGNPTVIFADNGTNFGAANNYLQDLKKLLTSSRHQESLIDVASAAGTE